MTSKSGIVRRKRKHVSRRKLYSSAQLWKPAPNGFNEKYNLTGDFYVPAHNKRFTKRTPTVSKSTIDNLRKTRGAKRARLIAKVQHSVESVAQRRTPINERQPIVPKLLTVKRLVPVVTPDGSFHTVKMTGAELAQARDRAQSYRIGRRNPRAIKSYEGRWTKPYVIKGESFIGDRAELSEAKGLMNKRQKKALDKAYAEMFLD